MSHDPQPLGGKIISKPVMIFGPLIWCSVWALSPT